MACLNEVLVPITELCEQKMFLYNVNHETMLALFKVCKVSKVSPVFHLSIQIAGQKE